MDTITVITIIAVFWLLGLLMAWSMCVVAARADPRPHGRGYQPAGHLPCGMRGRLPGRQGPSSSVSITLLLMNCFWMKTPN